MNLRDMLPTKWLRNEKLARQDRDDPFGMWEHPMNRLFNDMLQGFADENGDWGLMAGPSVDVSETDKDVEVTIDLPGMDEKDVDVTLSNGVLVVRGEKKSEKEEKGKNFYRKERSVGSFHRAIPLPAEVDSENVDATFKNGVLQMKLPKSESSVQRKVKVKPAT